MLGWGVGEAYPLFTLSEIHVIFQFRKPCLDVALYLLREKAGLKREALQTPVAVTRCLSALVKIIRIIIMI